MFIKLFQLKTQKTLEESLDSCYLSLSKQIKTRQLSLKANTAGNLKFDTINLSRETLFELKGYLYGLACIMEAERR